MNILTLIRRNWAQGPQTLRFPDRQPPAPGYRGRVQVDTALCVACGWCASVCVSGAIDVVSLTDHGVWDYDPGRCTYCGLCTAYCPMNALTQAPDHDPTCSTADGLGRRAVIQYRRCSQCGARQIPLGQAIVERAYGDTTPQIRQRLDLCSRCRRTALVHALVQGLHVPEPTKERRDGR